MNPAWLCVIIPATAAITLAGEWLWRRVVKCDKPVIVRTTPEFRRKLQEADEGTLRIYEMCKSSHP